MNTAEIRDEAIVVLRDIIRTSDQTHERLRAVELMLHAATATEQAELQEKHLARLVEAPGKP